MDYRDSGIELLQPTALFVTKQICRLVHMKMSVKPRKKGVLVGELLSIFYEFFRFIANLCGVYFSKINAMREL